MDRAPSPFAVRADAVARGDSDLCHQPPGRRLCQALPQQVPARTEVHTVRHVFVDVAECLSLRLKLQVDHEVSGEVLVHKAAEQPFAHPRLSPSFVLLHRAESHAAVGPPLSTENMD